jgi:hypothetical protein
MTENVEWKKAVTYTDFVKNARENIELMKARYNDLQLNEADLDTLKSIQNDIKILVLGTERCNDTAGNLPILAKLADASTKIQLRIINEATIQSLEDRRVALKKLYSDPEIQRQSLNEFLRLTLRADFILGRK